MITTLTIFQDNIEGESNLMPVHSPLVFLVDADYTGTVPDYIYCKVYQAGNLLNTFKCIPYQLVSTGKYRFMFIADSILRGYMESYEDFYQDEDIADVAENITKKFTLSFEDPEKNASSKSVDIVAIHAVSQFGEAPNKEDIYNNKDETIYCSKDQPVYLYVYDSNESEDGSNINLIYK
jgi:hypothetical protein